MAEQVEVIKQPIEKRMWDYRDPMRDRLNLELQLQLALE